MSTPGGLAQKVSGDFPNLPLVDTLWRAVREYAPIAQLVEQRTFRFEPL